MPDTTAALTHRKCAGPTNFSRDNRGYCAGRCVSDTVPAQNYLPNQWKRCHSPPLNQKSADLKSNRLAVESTDECHRPVKSHKRMDSTLSPATWHHESARLNVNLIVLTAYTFILFVSLRSPSELQQQPRPPFDTMNYLNPAPMARLAFD